MLELLRKVYNFDIAIALETVATNPSSFLYKQLKPFIKEQYPNDYKFIFVNNSTVQDTVLTHVLETLQFLDIPKEFILVITNQENSKLFFESNSIEVKQSTLPGEFEKGTHVPLFNIDNKLCPYVWAGFHVGPDGRMKPCCDYYGDYFQHDGEYLNVNKNTFQEILDSSDMKLLRSQFRKGIDPEGCKKNCLSAPKGKSTRYSLSKHKLQNVYGEIDWEREGQMKFLNGHLSNLCNLGCVICEPLLSSTVAVEELKKSKYKNVKQDPKYKELQINLNSVNSDSKFWRELDNHIPEIRSFELLGGEPLLNKNVIKLIQNLVDSGHSKKCMLQVVSNGTQFPSICDELHKFEQVFIHLSIDNVGEKFEYERYLSKWDEVEKNIHKFDDLTKNHQHIKLHFAVAVSTLNSYYLPELLTYLDQYNYDSYYFGDVYTPEEISLNNLTLEAKNALINKLSKFVEQFPKLDFVLNLVENTNLVDGMDFCKFIQEKDNMRNLNFMNSHKEIAKLMGYSNFNN